MKTFPLRNSIMATLAGAAFTLSSAAHAGQRGEPVAEGANLLEFDVVMDVKPSASA